MSDQEQTYYFYFLSTNLSYIIKLKENQKLLEKKKMMILKKLMKI